ncbi:type I glyceraldehyde-3-phosphate dehydrogenase [bacterium]|nr:type I glyceraldehyde-3-phosphate dehydrogenase [bacterium]UNM08531.1 MAG: type I glyceraldehyde-3-phosphate dehydrogenase [Planctomycetales bacterium]
MAIRLGINGFGRIGRQVARIAAGLTNIDLVAINDRADSETNAHLFKYDTTYGPFKGRVSVNNDELVIDGDHVKLISQADPAQIPWGDLGVDYVLESTGVFRRVEDCEKHLDGGAKYVLLSAPAKDKMPTYCFGINHHNWVTDGRPQVISNASCTTNCLAPMAHVLHNSFGIKKGLINTVHSYTNDQRLLDGGHKDLRRARSAAANIIPTSTGAAKTIGLIIPDLDGKMDGLAVRVPTVSGSLCDLTCTLEKDVTVDEVHEAIQRSVDGELDGILYLTHDPIVSTDIIQAEHSCIVDAQLTKVIGNNMVKMVGWYDNEWGYSVRCMDLIRYLVAENSKLNSTEGSTAG